MGGFKNWLLGPGCGRRKRLKRGGFVGIGFVTGIGW